MNGDPPSYRKVPARGFSWRGRGGLWLAEDHLLEVSSIIILEHYRRFFFRDVRAFAVQRTSARLIWGCIFGGIAAVCLLVTGGSSWIAAAHAEEDWHVALYFPAILFGIGAIFLVLWIVNLLLGPSCRCHLLTSTGWHALSAPTRLGPTDRVRARIVSVIEAAQGPPPSGPSATPR